MIVVRDAFVNELDFLRKQRVEAYGEYTYCVPEEHWAALKQAIESDADVQPGVEIIVAEVDGEVMGSVALFPAKSDAYEGRIDGLDYPEIRLLAVPIEGRGKGIATRLVRECIARAKAKGFEAIGLHTGDFMRPAIKLYEGLGFRRQPQLDFEPANDGVIVLAYRLNFDDEN